MSYRLIDANDLNGKISDEDYEVVLNAPCIYTDLPNGLDNRYHEIHRWIPVSEELPEDGQRAFILLQDGRTYSADFNRDGNGWWFENDNAWEYRSLVKAWMPIPKSEESEDKE